MVINDIVQWFLVSYFKGYRRIALLTNTVLGQLTSLRQQIMFKLCIEQERHYLVQCKGNVQSVKCVTLSAPMLAGIVEDSLVDII